MYSYGTWPRFKKNILWDCWALGKVKAMKALIDLSRELDIASDFLLAVSDLGKEAYYFKRQRIGKKTRTLRCAKLSLAKIQLAIKRKILNRLALPPEMHGWRKGHSPKTYVVIHVGKKVVLNYDIKDFFPSVGGARVFLFWKSAGYGDDAAKLLTRLTVCDNQLPQGTSTSPGIGNQILCHLNRRLSCLAQQHNLSYSNLADEIAISGRERAKRLNSLILKIISEEGFAVNPAKIKIRYRHERQQLAGIVVNKKISPGRSKYRELRVILHNCLKYGPESQNREGRANFMGHLAGRISYLQSLNPRLGQRMHREFRKL
jgi:RNA-directed DNA polymerase